MRYLFAVAILSILPLHLHARDKRAILKIEGHIENAGYDVFVYTLRNTLSDGMFILVPREIFSLPSAAQWKVDRLHSIEFQRAVWCKET